MARPRQAQVGGLVRVPKMAEVIAGRLRKQIICGELTEGDALPPEAVLMEQFGVSRPTLREAFRVLESESLITVRRGAHGGARVHVPDSDVAARYAALVLEYRRATVRDVYAVRAVLEPACAALAADRRTPEDLEKLRAAVREAEQAEDPVKFSEYQASFHQLLVSAAGSPTMLLLYEMVQHIIERSDIARIRHDTGSPQSSRAHRKGLRAHRRLVELIEAYDADGAAELWRKHLDEAEVYLLVSDLPVAGLDRLG